jgi:hypothetical protein
MKEKEDILKTIDRRDGMTVPDGFFEQFAAQMADKLPQRPELENPKSIVAPRSTWQRVRPYVYMAAMFGGVWCMLKMFTLMSSTDADMNLNNNPALASAVCNEQFVEDYVIDDVTNWDIYDYMIEDSIDVYNLEDSIYNANPEPSLPELQK